MPDETTETLRRLVAQRAQVIQQMTRAKNRIHSILHANLIPPYQGRAVQRGRQVLAEDATLGIG
jgi:transposase